MRLYPATGPHSHCFPVLLKICLRHHSVPQDQYPGSDLSTLCLTEEVLSQPQGEVAYTRMNFRTGLIRTVKNWGPFLRMESEGVGAGRVDSKAGRGEYFLCQGNHDSRFILWRGYLGFLDGTSNSNTKMKVLEPPWKHLKEWLRRLK